MFLGDVCTVSTSTILTAAICTNWLTTLCMSTVHVSDLGSQITIQLSNSSAGVDLLVLRFGWRTAVIMQEIIINLLHIAI